MAKFAANLTVLFNEVDFLARFEEAHRAGFKAVEFLFPYAYEPDVLAERLARYGLEQVLFNLPAGDWDAGERGLAAMPGREKEFEQSVETALVYAQLLNCKKVHAMCGIVDEHFTYKQHAETFLANIRRAADKFAAQGIELLIEPLNSRDFPGYFLAHQRDAVALIRELARSNVKLQLDLYHAQIMDGDLTTLIRDLAAEIGHVQVASVPHRQEPPEGELNYPFIFAALDRAGYNGWIGCEYNPKKSTQEGLGWIAPYL